GTGLLKPNVSAIVGELYSAEDQRRDAGFSIFYIGINVGAFTAPLVTSFLGEKIDWHLGFGAAGVGMTLGLFQYVIGRERLAHGGHPPRRTSAGTRRQEGAGIFFIAAVPPAARPPFLLP